MTTIKQQLISYIAPGAPATRRPASGEHPFLRPEIGFTPKWYSKSLGIDFGERWHTDVEYRRQTRIKMREELDKRFPGTPIGSNSENTTDILTGLYGASSVAAIYGVPIRYDSEQWPTSEHHYFSDKEVDKLTPPDLEQNPFFKTLMEQVDRIGEEERQIYGFMNWQGVLNNAQRLRSGPCGRPETRANREWDTPPRQPARPGSPRRTGHLSVPSPRQQREPPPC